jgi:hypothetical protein
MPKKKSIKKKRYTIKQIVDAFYNNEPIEKVVKMTQTLIDDEKSPVVTSNRDR